MNDRGDIEGIVQGNFQLQISGAVGQNDDVYTSEDLTAWTKVSTITLADTNYNFIDTATSERRSRFYCAMAVP